MAYEEFAPNFTNIDRIAIALHVGYGGKKTHLSYADIDRCEDTGELCCVLYRSMCGSAKWASRGQSAETLMQHTGTAKINCKRCGVKTVELNPKGYDIDNMRNYPVVYNEVKTDNMINALDDDIRPLVLEVIGILRSYYRRGGSKPTIRIDGKDLCYYDGFDSRAITTDDIMCAIYDGKEVSYSVWDETEKKLVRKTIN